MWGTWFFFEIFKYDFGMWRLWTVCDDPNSSNISYMTCLKSCSNDFGDGLENDLLDAYACFNEGVESWF